MRNNQDISDLPKDAQLEPSLAQKIQDLLIDLSDIEQELDDKAERSCINLVQIECPQIGGQVFDEASVIKKLDEEEAEEKAQEEMLDVDLELTSPTKQLVISEAD